MKKARTVIFISNTEKKCQLSKNVTDSASVFAFLNICVGFNGCVFM